MSLTAGYTFDEAAKLKMKNDAEDEVRRQNEAKILAAGRRLPALSEKDK